MSSASHEEHSKKDLVMYTGIAVFLAFVTGIELAPLFEIFYMPPPVLFVLSIVKFFMVVAFFMHLWGDDRIYTRMFVVPLVGATLMVGVLMVLFNTFAPVAGEDPLPITERYYANYNQTCSSWLRSHKTNRTYCASPYVEMERIASHPTCRAGPGKTCTELPIGNVPTKAEDPEALVAAYEAAQGDEAAMLALLKTEGEKLYVANCSSCHQVNGQGVPGSYPPLMGAGGFYGDANKHSNIIVNGLQGEIVVKGVTYNGAMSAFGTVLGDIQIAAIATYERHAWGNSDGIVLADAVAAQR
jgi:mono/diheme cytochrome c family protein